ncbi:hypothetical protein WKV44_00250 [Spirochaetia bacterium 38H-sp]|uniref:Leader peptide processing enzyme n=1 Tax=Rarispira pelagica TaxID=3141764 RepID=A0ABU9U9W9_9SPIR
MNKKLNTLLFILAATIVNVAILLGVCILLFIVYGRFIAPQVSPEVNSYAVLVILMIGFVLTFFIYNMAINILGQKIDMDKYFSPLFFKNRKK